MRRRRLRQLRHAANRRYPHARPGQRLAPVSARAPPCSSSRAGGAVLVDARLQSSDAAAIAPPSVCPTTRSFFSSEVARPWRSSRPGRATRGRRGHGAASLKPFRHRFAIVCLTRPQSHPKCGNPRERGDMCALAIPLQTGQHSAVAGRQLKSWCPRFESGSRHSLKYCRSPGYRPLRRPRASV